MLNVCTIIARNYLAHARVLADSFLSHHPDGRFTVLVVDDERRQFDAGAERFRCCRLAEIGLDPNEISRLASIYDVTELATAVKPLFLRHLLRSGDHVLYLDPDTRVYASLDTAGGLAREHSLVLTPHLTAPLPRDGRRVDDFHILSSGVYNLGFIGLGQRADAFIEWWWQRTRRDALVDHSRMMFTDQRWIDFAPGFFDHHILKDPTYNVAYWNLHARDLVWDGQRYAVDGRPLTFFHFSGFDVEKPHLLSKHQADRPRILLSERPAVARICQEYRDSLRRAGLERESVLPYGWSRLPSGIPFDQRMRRLYRAGLKAHEIGSGPEPPSPFGQESDAFLDWLNVPVGGGLRPRASRYHMALYADRPDLRRAFPDLVGADWPRYARWLRSEGVRQLNIPDRLLPDEAAAAPASAYTHPSQLLPGVNIAGYFRAELGIGEAARLLTSAVQEAGVAWSTLTYDATASRKAHRFEERGEGRAQYDINIVCVNADRTPDFIRDAGREFLDGRYTVGLWFWELESFPPGMHAGFDYVDEVWAATDFVANAVRTIGRRPVYTIPLPVPVPTCSPAVTRDSLGLPTSFMFLFMFDFFSILERKNPLGLIRAFDRAFRPDEGPVLVIKTINGDARLNDLEKLRAAAGGRRDIHIVDEYYTAEQKTALLGLCDCYVSLHRSEGFGLTMAEAMGLEKPVIATGYSGNLAFMTSDNSYLVKYARGRVPAECDPYPQGSVWAEPDPDHAAELMRRVYAVREEASRKARQARQDILTKHTVEASARFVMRRLDDIRQRPASTSPSAATAAAVGATLAEPTPTATLLSSLDALAAQLTPIPQVAPGRRLRGPLLAAQEMLLRLLRPYWYQQQHVQRALIDALRETVQLSSRAASVEPGQRKALEAVWRAIHALEQPSTPASFVDELRRIDAVIGQLQQARDVFERKAAQHLDRLTKEIEDVQASSALLEHRLYAPPYMSDPEQLSIRDERGRRMLGYTTASGDGNGAAFSDLFRGSEEFIRERQRAYLPLLRRHALVVDIGCGRGEMLDLLREAAIAAVGVEVDPSMIARSRAKGHAVEQTDGHSYLERQPDGSVPVIFSAQVVEHMTYETFRSFLTLSRAKLVAGGQLIFETVNPHSLEAFKTFYTDLTHQRPIFPEVAVALCRLTGFAQAFVMYANGTGDPERDRKTQGDYTVVATTPA